MDGTAEGENASMLSTLSQMHAVRDHGVCGLLFPMFSDNSGLHSLRKPWSIFHFGGVFSHGGSNQPIVFSLTRACLAGITA